MLLEISDVGGFGFVVFLFGLLVVSCCLLFGFFFVLGVVVFLYQMCFFQFRLHEVFHAVNDRNIFARHLCDYT